MSDGMISPAIERAAAALAAGPLTEAALVQHVFPLFSRVLARNYIYVANHSLGRPLDQTREDVAEAFDRWQTRLDDGWEDWLAEREQFRRRIAQLIGAPRPDCIVPKTAAGQGLRTVLNALPGTPHVLTTRGEFDAVDVILKQYGHCGRATVTWVEPEDDGQFSVDALIAQLEAGRDTKVDLVVVAQVMFMTGQVMDGLDRLAAACHARGTRLLVDAYHSIGAMPVDVAAMDADFVIGASYKYLRGGPGAGFLYVSPRALASNLCPLDVGWFAKRDMFQFERADPPQLLPGGDGYLEGTPPVFTWYQARAGQQFVLALGADRIRAYGLDRQRRLKEYLRSVGVAAIGGEEKHGAFLTVRHPQAMALAAAMKARGVRADARAQYLRLCPDALTRDAEMQRVAEVVAQALHEMALLSGKNQ
jgi:kynureninase